MFFRRVFSRKERSAPSNSRFGIQSNEANTAEPITRSPKRGLRKSLSDDKRGLSVLQLTPLWEHIIRTKSLPEDICEQQIFDEFVERFHDPEWQVRQHALRVLVDVLIVMGQRSDLYFQPILFPLIENLGHPAPAVRKGALDALKVYMTETGMIETVLLQIINLGMDRQSLQEKYGSRLCVGTMLSLPSLVHTCLGTSKQPFVLRHVIDALTSKMIMMPYQEVALKILLRIREMTGVREFSEYIAHGAYREFELLCNVYGLHSNPDSEIDTYMPPSSDSNRSWQVFASNSNENHCKVKRTELNWRNDDDELYSDDLTASSIENGSKYRKLPEIGPRPYPTPCPKSCSQAGCSQTCSEIIPPTRPSSRPPDSAKSDKKCDKEKVIMETEIQIQDTPVTMRIVEASNDMDYSGSFTDEDNGSRDGSVYEHSGVVRVVSDSELEEVNNNLVDMIPRTPKRVTFGGEEVKMRTPDSDSVLQSDNDDLNKMARQLFEMPARIDIGSDSSSQQIETRSRKERPKTVGSPAVTTSSTQSKVDNQLKTVRYKSASPVKRRSSFGQSGGENMSLSPRATHKGIEVLHNLQRSPSISPNRSRKNSPEKTMSPQKAIPLNNPDETPVPTIDFKTSSSMPDLSTPPAELPTHAKSEQSDERKATWETLGLVDSDCLRNLKSGVG